MFRTDPTGIIIQPKGSSQKKKKRSWVSDASSFPTPQFMRQQCLPSKVPPRTLHIRRISQAKLSYQTGEFKENLWQIEDTLSSSPMGVVFHEVFSRPQAGLEDFENSNTTCWRSACHFSSKTGSRRTARVTSLTLLASRSVVSRVLQKRRGSVVDFNCFRLGSAGTPQATK